MNSSSFTVLLLCYCTRGFCRTHSLTVLCLFCCTQPSSYAPNVASYCVYTFEVTQTEIAAVTSNIWSTCRTQVATRHPEGEKTPMLTFRVKAI